MYMEDCRVKRQWLAGGYVQQHTVRVPGSVYAIRFDEDKVVCGTQDSHIRVYDRKTWQNTLTFSGHRDWVGAVQYDDDKVMCLHAFRGVCCSPANSASNPSWSAARETWTFGCGIGRDVARRRSKATRDG